MISLLGNFDSRSLSLCSTYLAQSGESGSGGLEFILESPGSSNLVPHLGQTLASAGTTVPQSEHWYSRASSVMLRFLSRLTAMAHNVSANMPSRGSTCT